MTLKRLRRSRPSFRDLDRYETTPSSSETEIEPATSKRRRENQDMKKLRGKAPPYKLRQSTKRQSNVSQILVQSSDESSSDISLPPVNRAWKPTSNKDASNSKSQAFQKNKNQTPVSSALQRKKLELEALKRDEMRREENISVVTNQIIDGLVEVGITCRDVVQLCCDKLDWDCKDWKDVLKESKVIIYEPTSGALPNRKRPKSFKKKSLSSHSKNWSTSLEVDALSLCVLKSGGTKVNLREGLRGGPKSNDRSKPPTDCEVVDNISDLKCVFVHRSVIHNFLSEEQPSIIDLTRREPRLQIFAFGDGPEPSSRDLILMSPKVELILCAGSIIIPTFSSLFKKGPKNRPSGKDHFEHLKKLCVFHPFLKVCLHPSIHRQLGNCLSDKNHGKGIDVDFLIDFLASSDIDHVTETKPAEAVNLANWIKLDRNNICWLWSDSDEDQCDQASDEDDDEEILELHSIVKTFKEIQKELYTEFRKFIIALPEKHPYVDRNSIDGIELIEISKLQTYNII